MSGGLSEKSARVDDLLVVNADLSLHRAWRCDRERRPRLDHKYDGPGSWAAFSMGHHTYQYCRIVYYRAMGYCDRDRSEVNRSSLCSRTRDGGSFRRRYLFSFVPSANAESGKRCQARGCVWEYS